MGNTQSVHSAASARLSMVERESSEWIPNHHVDKNVHTRQQHYDNHDCLFCNGHESGSLSILDTLPVVLNIYECMRCKLIRRIQKLPFFNTFFHRKKQKVIIPITLYPQIKHSVLNENSKNMIPDERVLLCDTTLLDRDSKKYLRKNHKCRLNNTENSQTEAFEMQCDMLQPNYYSFPRHELSLHLMTMDPLFKHFNSTWSRDTEPSMLQHVYHHQMYTNVKLFETSNNDRTQIIRTVNAGSSNKPRRSLATIFLENATVNYHERQLCTYEIVTEQSENTAVLTNVQLCRAAELETNILIDAYCKSDNAHFIKILFDILFSSTLKCTLYEARMNLTGVWSSQILLERNLHVFDGSVFSKFSTRKTISCKKGQDAIENERPQEEKNNVTTHREEIISPRKEESGNTKDAHRDNNVPTIPFPVSPANTNMTEDVQSLRQPQLAYNPTLNSNTVVSLSKPEKLLKTNNSDDESLVDHTRLIRLLTWLPSEQLPSPKIDFTVALALDPIFQQLSRGNELGPRQTMKYELLRLCTLRNYPKEDKPFIIRIAGAGFYYAADGDEVVCYCCGIRRRDWTAECQPMRIHHRLSPNCSFLTRNAEVNIPVPPASPELMERFAFLNSLIRDAAELNDNSGYDSDGSELQVERQHLQGNSMVTQPNAHQQRTDSSSPSTVALQQPRHPHYGVMSKRLATYTGWPAGNGQTPEVLADAGFYYVGLEDCVRCFQCGTGLRQWDREDDPWIEHARYTLTTPCQYLINKKGSEFVELVRMAIDISQNESVTSQDLVGPSTDDDSLEAQPQTENVATNRNANATEGNQVSQTATGMTEGNADTANVKTNPSGQARSNAEISSTLTKASGTAKGKDRTSKENASSKGKKHVSDEQRTLLKENERLRDQTMCKICFERNVCIVFLPCGHLVTCAECAPSLRVCPICRKSVKGTVKTYMS